MVQIEEANTLAMYIRFDYLVLNFLFITIFVVVFLMAAFIAVLQCRIFSELVFSVKKKKQNKKQKI